ncbi:MAG: hypothetical protein AAGH49_07380 [Pseudomonadota bacterium]
MKPAEMGGEVLSAFAPFSRIPAQAGISLGASGHAAQDPRLRGDGRRD